MVIEIANYVFRVSVDGRNTWQNLDDFEGELPRCSYIERCEQIIEVDVTSLRESASKGDEVAKSYLDYFVDEIEARQTT